ncbi:MAG: hypothetical protein R3E10_10160 [Gemmatimonadota bacterium]
MSIDASGLLSPEELWRRLATRAVDAIAAACLLHHILARGTPKQRAAPPTPALQAMFRRVVVEVGAGGDVQERLLLGHLLDGESETAARRYDALSVANQGERAALLRRKGALFLALDPALAQAAFERAVATAPSDGNAWLGLCFARERLGDRNGGREAFAQASRHGADLSVMDEPVPTLTPEKRTPPPDVLARIQPMRGRALDAAVELFPKVRDRFPQLARAFPLDETKKWDLVASAAIACFAFHEFYDPDKYDGVVRSLFAPETRRKTFSPIPPARQQTFNQLWEAHGYKFLIDCGNFMAEVTAPLWKAASAGGVSEREARGLRTRAQEADERRAAEWVMGRMLNISDCDEPEHRLAELGKWLAEAGAAIGG